MIERGFWNGLPTEIERGTAEVADIPEMPLYWAKTEGIIGQRIAVVRVVLDGVNYGGGTTYLDDREGAGLAKVMGGGSPRAGHKDVEIVPGSFASSTPTVDDSGRREAMSAEVEATDELRERLRVVLAENGVDEAPATLHSWRCEYPERYGKCDCVAELVTDLVAVVAEARTEQREADADSIRFARMHRDV